MPAAFTPWIRGPVVVGGHPVRVLPEVVRREVQDRDAVGSNEDPMLAHVLAVENDLVPIDAADGDVALGRGDDVPAGYVPPRARSCRPARLGDRLLERRHVLGDADLGCGRARSRRGSGGNASRGASRLRRRGEARASAAPSRASRGASASLERGRGAEPAAVRPLALPDVLARLRVLSATGFAYG